VPAQRGEQTRVEVRNPDPTCNPYLALAVIFKAGLEGIKQQMVPSAPITENVYQMEPQQREKLNIARLPRHLEEALQALSHDTLVKEALGEKIYTDFLEAKLQEWDRFLVHVHPWEIDEYLSNF
jgi:glutamine synthetase